MNGSISKDEQKQRLRQGGARSLREFRRNVHRVSVFVRYVFGESLLRIAVDRNQPFLDTNYEINFIEPSIWQLENNCNLCKGKHKPTNLRCGASKGSLVIPPHKILDLKYKKLLPGKYKLANVSQRARQKHGTATIVKL